MHIALLNTKNTLRARYLLECFEQGLTKHGDTAEWVCDHKNYEVALNRCDAGVQVCFANKHHGNNPLGKFRIDVNEYMLKHSKRVLTIDTAFVKDQTAYENELAQKYGKHQVIFDLDKQETYKTTLMDIYYSVCFDGLKRSGDYCNKHVGSDRWTKLGMDLRNWRKDGDHILLLGQTLNGLSSQHVNIYDWYKNAVRTIRKVTDRRIVFRHHPRIIKDREGHSRVGKDKANLAKILKDVKNFERSKNFLLEDDLKNCWAAVGFTSNASVYAVISGIPLFAGDEANMAWPVANHKLEDIEKPQLPNRSDWANRLAYSQWTCAEMIDGLTWDHFRPHAREKPRYKVIPWR